MTIEITVISYAQCWFVYYLYNRITLFKVWTRHGWSQVRNILLLQYRLRVTTYKLKKNDTI